MARLRSDRRGWHDRECRVEGRRPAFSLLCKPKGATRPGAVQSELFSRLLLCEPDHLNEQLLGPHVVARVVGIEVVG